MNFEESRLYKQSVTDQLLKSIKDLEMSNPNIGLGTSPYPIGTWTTEPTLGTSIGYDTIYTPIEPFSGQTQVDYEMRLIKVFNGTEWIEVDLILPTDTPEEFNRIVLQREILKMKKEVGDV